MKAFNLSNLVVPKQLLFFAFIFFLFAPATAQQNKALISDSLFNNPDKSFDISSLNGWYYKPGNDSTWNESSFASQGWKAVSLDTLFLKKRNPVSKREGWLHLQLQLDSNMTLVPAGISSYLWAASDVYINSHLIASFGQTGAAGNRYKENNAIHQNFELTNTYNFQTGKAYTFTIYFVDSVSRFESLAFGERTEGALFELNTAKTPKPGMGILNFQQLYVVVCSIIAVISLLFLLLWSANRNLYQLMLFSAHGILTFIWLGIILAMIWISALTYPGMMLATLISKIAGGAATFLVLVIISYTFQYTIKRWLWVMFAISLFIVWVGEHFTGWGIPYICVNYGFYLFCIFVIIKCWRRLKGSQWAIAWGLLLSVFISIFTTYAAYYIPMNSILQMIFNALDLLAFPVSLTVYVAIRFREINYEIQTQAKEVVQLSEEKKVQALKQQEVLQEEVDRQTHDLRQTLNELKSTQAQLIQSEKMASLGELTAGIAHEIQNPLNFVNNFSEVNRELIGELVEEVNKGNTEEIKAIANDIKDNEEKINHHGKRADAIVKGMLQHSRQTSGVKEPTDINALCDEYMRLSYHGLRAKDKNFNADFKTDFDESIGIINIVPQDIGRVLLNLFNNAFYAVNERSKTEGERFKAEVAVQTKKENNSVTITVSDNGNGISQNIIDKIFQPFFTTKPTGQGTGLGLSLAYDIITKEHNGTLKVESKEGKGSKFIIQLPLSNHN